MTCRTTEHRVETQQCYACMHLVYEHGGMGDIDVRYYTCERVYARAIFEKLRNLVVSVKEMQHFVYN